jgi:hypothetical protein
MNRRAFLLAIPACCVVSACSSSLNRAPVRPYTEIESTNPDLADARTIVVFMPDTPQAREVWVGLRDELVNDFRLVSIRVEGRDCAPTIVEGLRRYRPGAIVLMNNPTLSAYRDLQRSSNGSRFAPAVVVMSSFLEHRMSDLAAVTGIAYEVPLITVVTNLRRLMASPINRIGIIARPRLGGFVDRQAALAARENIVVVTEKVSQDPDRAEIRRALRRLKSDSDALWVLNDDQLLTPRLIADAWLPGLNERPWIPAIVGAAPLVSPGVGFGTFALLPDHTALGAQAAHLLLDIADNGWTLPADADVESPLSTTATIDLVQARERFVLRPDALRKVDRVLQ